MKRIAKGPRHESFCLNNKKKLIKKIGIKFGKTYRQSGRKPFFKTINYPFSHAYYAYSET